MQDNCNTSISRFAPIARRPLRLAPTRQVASSHRSNNNGSDAPATASICVNALATILAIFPSVSTENYFTRTSDRQILL